MIEYYILFGLIVVLGLIFELKGWNQKKKAIYCIICGILICALMFLRKYTGWDTNAYYGIYSNLASSKMSYLASQRLEKAFALMYKAFSNFSFMTVTGQRVTSVVVALLITIQIYKYCDNPMLAFAGFIGSGALFMAMNYQRQIIAMCIIGFSFVYIKRGEILKFTMLVLLAATFHYSSLIVLPCYFIFKLPINKITIALYAFGTWLIFAYSETIFKYAMYYVDVLRFGITYEFGVESYSFGAEMLGGVPSKYLFLLVGLCVLTAIFAKKLKEKNEYANVLIHFLFVTMFFEIIGVNHAYISRFAITFMMPAFMVLSCGTCEIVTEKVGGILKISQTKSKYIVYAVTLLLYILMMTIMIKGVYNGCYPYMTVWDWR